VVAVPSLALLLARVAVVLVRVSLRSYYLTLMILLLGYWRLIEPGLLRVTRLAPCPDMYIGLIYPRGSWVLGIVIARGRAVGFLLIVVAELG
jgi:hypothetical protein